MIKKDTMRHAAEHPKNLKSLVAALLFALPLSVIAAPTATPNAGSILQQIHPAIPPAPLSKGTGLTIEGQGSVTLPPTVPFMVKHIKITGNTLFDVATLHALVMGAEGKNLTLTELEKLAARITDYYYAHGYPLARAIIPAQMIHQSEVEIEVIEARYGKINLNNNSLVNDALLQATLSTLQSGQPIGQSALDHSLLLLSDIAGVATSATLKPGQAAGTADLQVETTPTPAITGNLALDNDGNRYTGRARMGGSVSFLNPLHHGDDLNVSILSSGSGMNYGKLSYEVLLDGAGTRVGGSYSMLNYVLGDTLASINGHGTAQVSSIWAKRPFIRSRDINLYGQIKYDNKQLKDHIDTNSTFTDRTLSNWEASLSGDSRDTLLSGGVNSWNVGLTSGYLSFDDAAAQAADAATAKIHGAFSKLTANIARLQQLTASSGLYLSFSGQWANTNLDSGEKMVAGGPYTVRAYDMGVLSGDSGYLGSAEFRRDLGSLWQGQWQAIAFVDSEHVTVNKNTWTAGANGETLSGAGLGLNWAGQNQWGAKLYVATAIGPMPVLVASARSVMGWVQISKSF